MNKNLLILIGVASASIVTGSASTVSVLPGDTSWKSQNNSGNGSSAITNTEARSGNGSLELYGDKTRFKTSPSGNLGLLSSLSGFTFDWMVATDSIGASAGAAASYSPALRLHITDGFMGLSSGELIWENAYNGGSPAVKGTWYTTDTDDNFWRYKSLGGPVQIYNRSISDWLTMSGGFSSSAYISGISVGVGSSAGAGYHAFADNVTLSFAGGTSTTYNFEASSAPVPDSGSTLLLLGATLTGFAAWKRKSGARA